MIIVLQMERIEVTGHLKIEKDFIFANLEKNKGEKTHERSVQHC